jgi:hypothetical protein
VRYQDDLRRGIEASRSQAADAVGVKIVEDVDRQSLKRAMEPLCAALVAEPSVAALVGRIRALALESEGETARR